MFVTTATAVGYCRKLPSDSSASTTNAGPAPRWALEPEDCRGAPTTYDGSAPAAVSIIAVIAEVVVLPCVPVIEIAVRPSMRAASAALRCQTSSPLSRAAASSGLDSFTALETTTVRALPICSARWPTYVRIPDAASLRNAGESAWSEPVTSMPRSAYSWAMPLMPAPPIAMKCTGLTSSAGRTGIGSSSVIVAPPRARSLRPVAPRRPGRARGRPRTSGTGRRGP